MHPPGSGTTPLHLAASLGRGDIVDLLLEQPLIDDTLQDARGQTCKDVAKGKDVVRAIEGMTYPTDTWDRCINLLQTHDRSLTRHTARYYVLTSCQQLLLNQMRPSLPSSNPHVCAS